MDAWLSRIGGGVWPAGDVRGRGHRFDVVNGRWRRYSDVCWHGYDRSVWADDESTGTDDESIGADRSDNDSDDGTHGANE